MGNGAWVATQVSVGCLHFKRPWSVSCDVPNPNLNLSSPKGAGHEENVHVMQTVQVPCSPRAGYWCFLCPSMNPFTELPWALVNGGVLSSFPAFEKKKKNSIMLLTEAILHWYQVLLSSLLLASYDRATELDPSLHAHTQHWLFWSSGWCPGYKCYQKHSKDAVTNLYSLVPSR